MSTTAVAPAPGAAARATRPGSALLALTRAEGLRLLRHPLFVVGMALSILTLVQASTNSPNERGDFQQEIVDFLVGNCFLFLGGAIWTFLATFLSSSRERRDTAEEFYAGGLVAPRTRTAAALLSVAYAGAAAAVLVGIATLVFLGPDGAHDVLGREVAARPLELLQGPLYVVMAGVLGVLLGTWAMRAWIAVLAAVALFLPPLGLVAWYVFEFEPDAARGAFGGLMAGLPPGWHLFAMGALTVLAASIAMLRHDRRLRVALLVCAGLGATAAAAIAGPTNDGVVAGCTPSELQPVGSPRIAPVRVTTGNLDFERGNLDGWQIRTQGSGSWRVYTDGATPPDPADSDLFVPFQVVDPPQGRFAVVTDMCFEGSRILYRDVKLEDRRELRFTLFYRSSSPLSSSQTLDYATPSQNVQFRVDVMDPAAPVDSLAPRHILDTVFRTTPGDPLVLGPRSVAFDLSPWAGQTVRLRFAQVDNTGPLRVVIDDVKLDPAGR